MALRRRSALQAAEKLVARGRLEAAVKQYRKALEESPNDTGTLNRLGDLYARLNRVSEAVEMFTSAAKHFTSEGFFVKAIAIYKKIIRLDPTLIKVYETLADLYYRQGLVNEARAQYQVVADYYKQANNQPALAAVHEKMVELEPDNPSHRLKLAELYCASDRIPAAMEQYQKIATFMLHHDKLEEAFKVYLGAFELKPDDLGFLTDVIVQLTDLGHDGVARRLLDQALERNPDAIRVAELVDLPMPEPAERRGAPAPLVESIETEDAEEPHGDGEPALAEDAVGLAETPPAPELSEESDVVELDLDQEPEDMSELLGETQETAAAGEPPVAADAKDTMEEPEGVELVDLADLVSLEAEESRDSVAHAEPDTESDAEPEAAKDETREFEIDLDELEASAESAVLVDAAETDGAAEVTEGTADEGAADEGAADLEARAEELLTEANVLSHYSLENKAIELLETARELVPGHLEVAQLLMHLHHQAGRSEQICEIAQHFVKAGRLPEPLSELIDDWGFGLDHGRVSAPAVEAEEQQAEPVEVEAAPAADARLTWLDEEPDTAPGAETDIFGEEEEFFDLAAELEEELIAEETKLSGETMPQVEEQSIEEIVEGFKQGVAETLSTEDFDTHYNLGIAYREMGLVDEAIGEFQLAAKSEQYLVDCCSLLGVSFLEKGFPDLAVKWYERGLKAPGVSDEEKLGLLYELGNLYLTTGNRETAKDTFAEIYGANSNYRDVVAKLEELRQD